MHKQDIVATLRLEKNLWLPMGVLSPTDIFSVRHWMSVKNPRKSQKVRKRQYSRYQQSTLWWKGFWNEYFYNLEYNSERVINGEKVRVRVDEKASGKWGEWEGGFTWWARRNELEISKIEQSIMKGPVSDFKSGNNCRERKGDNGWGAGTSRWLNGDRLYR